MARNFFEKLTGMGKSDNKVSKGPDEMEKELGEMAEETEGELAIDMYQTPADIVVKTMVAGVRPEDLDITITRDMVTVKGKREESNDYSEDDFFHKELYWGTFSRTVVLPQEIEVEEAEATNKNGLLTITLPKLDKNKQAKVKVKSL